MIKINLLKKYCHLNKSILIKSISTAIIVLSLLLILPSFSFSYILLSDDTKISLDLGVQKPHLIPSENISDFFDISKPFVIKITDLDKEVNPDIKVLHEFYKHKKTLHKYQEYTEVKDYSIGLLQLYYSKLLDPDSYAFSNQSSNLFIGIGSSPTPMISFWENLKKLDASSHKLKDRIKSPLDSSEFLNIPFSKNLISDYYFYLLQQQQSPQQQSLYKERYINLFKLLDYYTQGVVFTGKNIIIIDFAISGMSIALFTRLFLKYLNYKNISVASINLHLITTLSSNSFMKGIDSLENVLVDNIYKDYTMLSFKLYNSSYDIMAKYPDYQQVYNDLNFSEPLEESPEYSLYSFKLKKVMEKDTDLIQLGCPQLFSIFSGFKKN